MALFRQPSKGLLTSLAVLSGLAAAAASVQPASAQEPAACLSTNPSDWPAPSRPYFMILVDTSGSMASCTTPPSVYPAECNQAAAGYKLNSCGMIPNRINDAKCALRQTIQAFSGEANFGLATFASYLSGCQAGACTSDCGAPTGGNCGSDFYQGGTSLCTWNVFTDANPAGSACGNFPTCAAGAGPASPNFAEGAWRNGANVVVGLNKDQWWSPPSPASNTAELLEWFDGQCTNSRELFAAGGTPIAGGLQGVTQYLRAGWTRWTGTNYCPPLGYTFNTPADTNDRQCRSINVILLTDGDESCDTQTNAVNAASDLNTNGVTIGGKNWKVPVYVINFAGGSVTNTNQIAAAGGTSASILANNEVEVANAFSTIIGNVIKPETCDNADNNCNGCTDEGYKHYCNLGPTQQPGSLQTCCAWATPAQRTTCLTNYQNSITPANPGGNKSLLPCTDATQQTQPANWLCYDPGDVCDNLDNNCSAGADENQIKCGSPLACPTTEVCDGKDNDCDGLIDENNPGGGGACSTGIPGKCSAGTVTCVNSALTCVQNQQASQYETCGNAIDDNCNGQTDENADYDGDGYGICDNDCCDNPTQCNQPATVNPGAFEVLNNSINDDCDATTSDTVAPAQCGPAPLVTPTSAMNLVNAMDICQTALANPPTNAQKKWGVLSAVITSANGVAPAPTDLQRGVLANFGPNVLPRKGTTMAALSSGTARDATDAGFFAPQPQGYYGGGLGTPPAAYLAAHGGTLQTAPGCTTASDANDSANLKVQMRVPTNAQSFTYKFKFYSTEYPEWLCTNFNDFYLALLTSNVAGIPADKNISFDSVNNPVSVNNAFFDVCSGCSAGTNELIGTGVGGTGSTLTDGGGTTWLTTTSPITPGETMTIEFMIWDTGDQVWDSTVLLDAFEWSTASTIVGTSQ